LQDIGDEFSTMKQVCYVFQPHILLVDHNQAISVISDMAGQILSTQVIISQKADFLSDVQSKASETAAGLVEALTQMTDTAHIELDKINGSAQLIQEQLLFRESGNLRWKDWLMNIVAFIYRSAPQT
jgi:ligand-binding sensor protein